MHDPAPILPPEPTSNPSHEPTPAPRERVRQLLRLLVVGGTLALLAAAFLLLGGEVMEGDTHAIDDAVMRAAHALRVEHPWIAPAMRDVSALGGRTVLTLAVVIGAGYLLLVGRRTTALLVALSSGAGALLVTVFKDAFGRARPDPQLAELVVSGLSFPSGHASMSAAIYLTFGALLAATRPRRRERLYLLGAAAAVAALVGVSRVLLGVHWPTDVLGGWAFGSAWAIGWLLVARRIAR
jgi:undecaprenyl-diphosphatase